MFVLLFCFYLPFHVIHSRCPTLHSLPKFPHISTERGAGETHVQNKENSVEYLQSTHLQLVSFASGGGSQKIDFALELKLSKTLSGLVYFVLQL